MPKQIRIAVTHYDGVPMSIRVVDQQGQHVAEQIVAGVTGDDHALYFHVHEHQAIIIAEVGDQRRLESDPAAIEGAAPGLSAPWKALPGADHDAATDDGGLNAAGGDDVRRVE